jgi:hypothetical protein
MDKNELMNLESAKVVDARGTPCLKEREMGADVLIEDAKMVAAARVVMETLEASSTLSD